jgi:hypothetical protein
MIGYDRDLTRDEDQHLNGVRFRTWDEADYDECCQQCGEDVGEVLLPDGTEDLRDFYAGGYDTYCVRCYEGPGS